MAGEGPTEAELRESVEELRDYLADGIPPLLAAGAVGMLVRGAPEAITAQLQSWLDYQFQARGRTVACADLAYHALRKLHLLGELGLVPKSELGAYLATLIDALAPLCPPAEQEVVRASLERLQQAPEQIGASGFHVGRALGGAAGSGAATALDGRPEELSQELRRFALLLERLRPEAAAGPGTTAAAPGEELIARLLGAAATTARDPDELAQYLRRLREMGVLSTDAGVVVRTLSHTLPNWAAPVPSSAAAAMSGSARALHRFVDLAASPEQRVERFSEVARAVVDEFNGGSLARAVALVQVAESLLAEGKVPASEAELVRGRAHESLDGERLRVAAVDRQLQPLLRRLLGFFPALQPAGLLAALDGEPDRALRRLRLTLLEVHGEAARPVILDRLDATLADGRADAWFYQRNLIYLLHRIPCPPEALEERELRHVLHYAQLAHHPRLVGEAFIRLGQIHQEAAHKALLTGLQEIEAALDGTGSLGLPAEDLERLRGLAATGLLRGPSSAGRRAVVTGALRRLRQTSQGDRLAELRGVDLSAEPDVVELALQTLRALVPRKLLGVVIRRNAELLIQIVQALAATPTAAVRAAFHDLAARFQGEPFGVEAARALAAFDAGAPAPRTETAAPAPDFTPAPQRRMEGDLLLFGLPNLLQSLAQSGLTGVLTLRDRQGAVVATLELEKGVLAASATARLSGETAFYELLERSTASSFQFVSREPAAAAGARRWDVLGLLMEGMRRFDEYERARTLVPDDALLTPSGVRPSAPAGETDGAFVRDLWSRLKAGSSARGCEEALATDPFRVRSLLAHWLEEGAVTLRRAPRDVTATA